MVGIAFVNLAQGQQRPYWALCPHYALARIFSSLSDRPSFLPRLPKVYEPCVAHTPRKYRQL